MKIVFEPTLSELQLCARICHEVNRAYCFSIGDSSHAHWYNATQDVKQGVIAAVRQHVDSGLTLTAEQSHNNWCVQMVDKGWKRGELDREKKRAPNLLPYNRLPPEEQTKYWLFRAAVHAFFHQHFEDAK